MAEYLGPGGLRHLAEIVAPYDRLLLVTGETSYETCGAAATVAKLGKQIVEEDADIVVAIGGGSIIDRAKLLRLGVDLVAIPTTAGSGSEATTFAVYYVDGEKHSLEVRLPEHAIVDAELTFSMPPRLAAVTGMDALAQAIEAYWSVNSTGVSRWHSASAVRRILAALPSSVRGDEGSRVEMSLAANSAGKAINIAKTTACHAISYTITSRFGIPHGHAVALTLPQMIRFNDTSGVAALLGAKTTDAAACKVETLMTEIGLEGSLEALGIYDIETIVEGVDQQRLRNNPRPLTKKDIRRILTCTTIKRF